MLIEYKKANILTTTYAITPKQCGSVRFMPGINEISRKEWEKVKDAPKVNRLLSDEILVLVVKDDPKIESESGILDLKPQEASVVIKRTFSLETLEDWKSKDNRKAVITALDRQIKHVNDHAVKKKKEGE